MVYRSRPTHVEAIQLSEGDEFDALSFAGPKLRWLDPGSASAHWELLAGKDGAQGWVPVPWGHWIVRNPQDDSDYWPVDPAFFAAKYEAAW